MKFSIRDLFLVTVIVALGLGWWLDRSHLAEENRHLEMREQLRTLLPVIPQADGATKSPPRNQPIIND
jgi:hypothetical protein